MKIRSNYVSNSSSSSFVVTCRNYFENKDKILISEENIKKLTSFGFKFMKGYSNNILFNSGEIVNDISDFNETEDISLYYDVVCNEDEVYEFLFKNHIPFMASIHYDYELWVYNGGNYYEVFQNYGIQRMMHHNEAIVKSFINYDIPNSKPYEKIYLEDKK